MPYGITQCHLPPGRGDIPAFTSAKLVLNLATPEGCNAELTCVSWLHTEMVYPPTDSHQLLTGPDVG